MSASEIECIFCHQGRWCLDDCETCVGDDLPTCGPSGNGVVCKKCNGFGRQSDEDDYEPCYPGERSYEPEDYEHADPIGY